METNPKISRYLVVFVIALFAIVAGSIYYLLSSEKLTNQAITQAITDFVPAEKLQIKIGKIQGCLLDGIKIDSIEIKHVKPNFEIVAKDFSFITRYNNLLTTGALFIEGSLDSLKMTGMIKLNPKVNSIPAFIGLECLASLPGNIKISSFNINSITAKPFDNKDLEITSTGFNLKATEDSNLLSVATKIRADWKKNALANADYEGIFNQTKNKVDGKIKVDIAKQHLESELNISSGKKGFEIGGYVASQTLFDLKPISQWLGYMWQLEYPYSISGEVSCQGSWLYSSKIGFLGNLAGNYKKLSLSVVGDIYDLAVLNGSWKYFDDSISLTDSQGLLFGSPCSLNGKVEAVTTNSRKFDLSLSAKNGDLQKITSEIPWLLRKTNDIPCLVGTADFSLRILGNRPMVNAILDVKEMALTSQEANEPKTTGKLFYTLPETGKGSISIQKEGKENRTYKADDVDPINLLLKY